MAGVALVVGSFLAWRVVLCFRGRTAYVPRFLAVMTFCLGLMMFPAFGTFEGSIRLGFLVTAVALYLPMLLAAVWTFAKERQ